MLTQAARLRSKELDLGRYDTDKIQNRYLDWYDPILGSLVEKELSLLEIGIHKGASLLLWRDYFPRGMIVGIDSHVRVSFSSEDRIRVFEGMQQDTGFLRYVAKETAPEGFDVIIDDASHIGGLTRASFWHLFDNHLKPGGLYAIEDWGTGYWDDWPDGRTYRPRARLHGLILALGKRLKMVSRIPCHNHSFGMVGFIKELVDEQGAPDLTRANLTGVPLRASKFERMTITPSIVFVEKASK